MMRKDHIAIHHGWGFAPQHWERFAKHFSGSVTLLDRGYFDRSPSEEKSVFKDGDNNILITHSMGLHLVSDELLNKASLLVIIGGFIHFGMDFTTKMALSLMKGKIKSSPKELLSQFYERCFFPQKATIEIPDEINSDLLANDLDLLGKSHLDLTKIKRIPKVLIFHGKTDKIVSFDKALDLQKAIPQAELFSYDDTGHGIFSTHSDEIIAEIKSQLSLEPVSYKEKIVKRFTKNAKYYDNDNALHRQAADLLEDLFVKIDPDSLKEPILEIGAGTGLVTKKIITHFSKNSLEVSDISEEMLKLIKGKISSLMSSIKFSKIDGETLSHPNHYGMIVSGMAFQWFSDLYGTIDKLLFSLTKKGHLVFSCEGNESFKEWKTVCEREKVPFTKNRLPKKELLLEHLKKYDPEAVIEEKSIKQTFSSPIDFFHWLKKRGASQATHDTFLSPTQWKKLLSAWKAHFPDQTVITHQILVAKATRRTF